MELRLMERLFWIISELHVITWALKSREEGMLERCKERRGSFQSARGTQSALAGFEFGRMGSWVKECVWPLEVRNVLQLTASK